MRGGWPAAHVGPDFSDQLQRGLRADGVNLAEVGTASEAMQRGADVEARLMAFGIVPAARGWQHGCGQRLCCGERVEQRFDGVVAFGDLLKVELVGREVLPQ